MWHWEQGRLAYFSLDKIRIIAASLIELEGADLTGEDDPLRVRLPAAAGLPFAPKDYKIWRNYARVFKILGLASKVESRLTPTHLARRLIATGDSYLTYDEYMQHVAKVFYFPSPAFEGYNDTSPQIFPFCAVIKLLICKAWSGGNPSVSAEEVFSLLIGNQVTGLEAMNHYEHLQPSGMDGGGAPLRQVREMLIFLSQLSYLSWIKGSLVIDMSALANLGAREMEALVTPIVRDRKRDQDLEVQNMYRFEEGAPISFDLPVSVDDMVFTEGKKVRVAHLRTERNQKVVQHYFENTPRPRLCDICDVEVAARYPWLDNLIEVHHVLPLASPLQVDSEGTSIEDLVGLCPNCHRATHAYYRNVLAKQNLADFLSKEHAWQVYSDVKSKFVAI